MFGSETNQIGLFDNRKKKKNIYIYIYVWCVPLFFFKVELKEIIVLTQVLNFN